MDFAYLMRVLLKRKWIILGSAILAAGIAYFLTKNEQKNYLSTSRISTGFAVPDEIKLNENFTLMDAEVKFNNAITAWMSPSVISLLSYQLILHDLNEPNPFRRLTEEQKNSPTYKQVNINDARKVFEEKLKTMSVLTSYKPEEKKMLEFLHLYRYDFGMLRQHINIYQVPRTDYIQIDCISENPELSAFIVNNVFEQFINYYRNIRSSKSQESIDTLLSIVEKKKQALDEKNRMLRGEGLTDVKTESSSKLDLIADLEKTLTFEKSKQTDNYYELRKVNQRIGNVGTNTTTSNEGGNNEELIIARKAVNDAYKKYLATNSEEDLKRYNDLQAEYKRKYANINTGGTNSPAGDKSKQLELLRQQKNDLEIDIQASDAKIKALEARISVLKGNVSSISSRGATVETLMEEVKLAEKEYIEAKQKYNEAADMTSSAVNNFRQLQVAQPAIEPLPSKRMLIVGMAGTAAFLAAILIITLLTYLDSSVKTPRVFARNVGLKLISMVNFVNLKKKDLKDLVATSTDDLDKLEKKRSNVFRESIRKLRYEVEISGKKIFLFTSTKKSQGKTTLIQALSYSLSLSKKKILIIDTNFSNNDLTRQLEAEPVLEQISMNHELSRFKDKLKIISGGENEDSGSICVIGSEGGDYTPSEVLPRDNILHYLNNLTKDFDYIFLEGPPLNDFSDSKELTQYVEGVIAIFSAADTIKQIDKESIRFYKDLNGKFIGSVLNMVDLENVNTI